MNKKQEEILNEAMARGIELEKSKYDDWDDNKHLIKVTVSTVGDHLKLHFVRELKK
jgi:hypothetical protein